MEKYQHRTEQKCWTCRNAATNGCSWAAKLQPVKGWDAELRPYWIDGKEGYTFAVRECPEYVKD